MTLESSTQLLDKLLIPAVLALLGWLVKDWLLDSHKARQSRIREEWLFQLREIYCPLFLWSGVVMFNGKRGADKLGVSEMSAVLSRAASLVPIKHFHVYVRLLEAATAQQTTPVTQHELKLARDYVYSKIEHLQIALFGKYAEFDPTKAVSVLEPLRAFSSLVLDLLIQLSIWAAAFLAIALIYWAVAGNSLATIGLLIVLFLVLVAELRRRVRTSKALAQRLRT